MRLTSTLWNETTGRCDCCGRASKKIWGDLSDADGPKAVYFVQWTVDSPQHPPNIDLVLGQWGEGTDPANRELASLTFRPSADGGSFTVIDAAGRPPDNRGICGRALRRDEVVGTPIASNVFSLVDALWLSEPRLAEVRALNELG